MGVYINDSTYLNASDPNSMRDQGQVRNAPYNFNMDDCQRSYMQSQMTGRMSKSSDRPSSAYVSGNIRHRDSQN